MRSILYAAALAACSTPTIVCAAANSSPQPRHETDPFKLTTVATGLEHPWGIALLPDGRMLVTERPGRMRIVGKGRIALGATRRGFPKVYARGQGGLLDVTLKSAVRE